MKQLLNEQKTQDRNRHKGTRQKLLSGFFCKGTVWHQELKTDNLAPVQFGTKTICDQELKNGKFGFLKVFGK